MIQQKMNGYPLSTATSIASSTEALGRGFSNAGGSTVNGHSHTNNSYSNHHRNGHHSTITTDKSTNSNSHQLIRRPKPPSFSSHPSSPHNLSMNNGHRIEGVRNHSVSHSSKGQQPTQNVLPLQSIPNQIQPPSVPLAASIDAILHHKRDHNELGPLTLQHSPKRKRRRQNEPKSTSTDTVDSDPMALDFNLVTIPEEILADVKSIVAQNCPRKTNTKNANNCNSNHHEVSPSPSDATTQSIKTDRDEKVKIKADAHSQERGEDDKDRVKVDTVEIVECSLCHQAMEKQNLQSHLDTAHSFKCNLCSKSFQKRIDLKRHQRLHDPNCSDPLFECKICYKTYRSPGSLHNHMRLHEVTNLFTCSFCKKGFTQSHHLKRHLRIHTGVTPFNCRYCQRPFKYNTSCRRHERTVHKDLYRPVSAGSVAKQDGATMDQDDGSKSDDEHNVEGDEPERCSMENKAVTLMEETTQEGMVQNS